VAPVFPTTRWLEPPPGRPGASSVEAGLGFRRGFLNPVRFVGAPVNGSSHNIHDPGRAHVHSERQW